MRTGEARLADRHSDTSTRQASKAPEKDADMLQKQTEAHVTQVRVTCVGTSAWMFWEGCILYLPPDVTATHRQVRSDTNTAYVYVQLLMHSLYTNKHTQTHSTDTHMYWGRGLLGNATVLKQ